MTPSLRLVVAAFCTGLGASLAPMTAAQTPAPSIQQPAPAYSEDELKTFAVAALEVLRINDVYLPKLKMATTPEQQQQVERTASDEMVKAVEKEGLSVAKYKEIMSHAEANPDIAQRVMKHMKEAQSAPGAGR
jgi:hypothetical protein